MTGQRRAGEDRSFASLVTAFLAELAHANRSPHTRRAYAADLAGFCSFYRGATADITPEVLRAFFATLTHLSPATRARRQAALASFLRWAYREGLIDATPMARVERVALDPPQARWLERVQVERILAAIPARQRRDRLLFRLIFETGVRVGEAPGSYVEDVRLTLDDEHVAVLGKGNRRRTVLLDDPRLVGELRAYLTKAGYRFGPLFRAAKNGRGGPLRYQSAQVRRQHDCGQAGVVCTLHQLRHSHATELINAGVSVVTIRKRLGHKNLQTTLRYADQSDATADAELRAWCRRRGG